MNDYIYLVALHMIGFSQKDFHILFKDHQNYRETYLGLGISDVCFKILSVKSDKKQSILQKYRSLDLPSLQDKLSALGTNYITYTDPNYPESLKHVSNPPYLLYVRGVLQPGPRLACVGSRAMSQYGKRVIESLIPDISQHFQIVSGGALGVDSQAHHMTLKSNGYTIAVLGTGVFHTYPKSNHALYKNIFASGGALISIFPPDAEGFAYHFPIRNEIIVGLVSGVLVIEAQKKSGSLITASLALEHGKDVFVCPGSIFSPASYGCHTLLEKGSAQLVSSAKSILDEYNIGATSTSKQSHSFDDPIERDIYECLCMQPAGLDDIQLHCNKDLSLVTQYTTLLEMRGMIQRLGSGIYQIA